VGWYEAFLAFTLHMFGRHLYEDHMSAVTLRNGYPCRALGCSISVSTCTEAAHIWHWRSHPVCFNPPPALSACLLQHSGLLDVDHYPKIPMQEHAQFKYLVGLKGYMAACMCT
jgi:hypothetical protein